LQFVN